MESEKAALVVPGDNVPLSTETDVNVCEEAVNLTALMATLTMLVEIAGKKADARIKAAGADVAVATEKLGDRAKPVDKNTDEIVVADTE
jgi:hypothetical protein